MRRRRRWWALRRWLCQRDLHWPIRFCEDAYPASYDPPHPPEPGWACDWCGHARVPYRFWWLERTWWAIHAAWIEWRARRREPAELVVDPDVWPCSGPGWPD